MKLLLIFSIILICFLFFLLFLFEEREEKERQEKEHRQEDKKRFEEVAFERAVRQELFKYKVQEEVKKRLKEEQKGDLE